MARIGTLIGGAVLATLAIALSGCSSSSSSGDGTTDTGMASDTGTPAVDGGKTDTGTGSTDAAADAPAAVDLTVKLKVPADYTGTPTRVVVAAFSKLPVAGPPDGGILYQADLTTVTPGMTIDVKGDASGVSGDYFVLAILYQKGGGSFSPKDGVDYDAATSKALAFNGKALDAGTLNLAVHHTGDGH